MAQLPSYILGAQSLAVVAVGIRALLFPALATSAGELLEAMPPLGLHVIGYVLLSRVQRGISIHMLLT